MKTKTTFFLVLGGNVLALLLIYLPFALKSLEGLELLGAGMYNLFLIIGELVACTVVGFTPRTQRFAAAWWLNWGLLLLMSFPACLVTGWLSQQLAH